MPPSSHSAPPASAPFAARLIGFALVVLVPLLALTAYGLRRDLAQERSDAVQRVHQLSSSIAIEGEQVLQRAERLLAFLAERSEIQAADAPRCNALLRGLLSLDPALANAGLLDRQGRGICSALELPEGANVDFGDSPAFAQARVSREPQFGAPMRSRLREWLVLPLTMALQDDKGQLKGVLFVTINLSRLSEGWQRYGLPEGSAMVMHDATGRIVARYPDASTWIGQDASEKINDFIAAHPDGYGTDTGLDGVRRVYAMTHLSGHPWRVVAGLPDSVVFADARRREREAVLGIGGALALVLVLAVLLSRSLARPLRDLQQVAAAVAQGQRERRADESVPGEFREVAREFNRMTDQLGRAELQLRRINGFYEALSRVNKALVRGRDRQQLCHEVCASCVDAGHALMATVWMRHGEQLQLFASAGPVLSMYGSDQVTQDFSQEPMKFTPTAEALRSGRPVVSNDYQQDPRTRAWHERARQTGVRAMVAVPLSRSQAVEAVLVLHMNEPDWFDEPLVTLLSELVDDLALGLDILDRERARAEAEREAHRSREQFQRLFEAAPLPVAVFSQPELRLIAANQACAQTLGRPRTQMLGLALKDLGLSVDRIERLQQRLREQRGRLREYETEFCLGDGVTRRLQLHAEAIDYEGQPALLAVGVDLTQHRLSEQALRDSLSRFELAVATGHVWAWQPDIGLKPPEALLDTLGYSDEQLGHQPGLWLPEVHEQDRPGLLQDLQRQLQARQPLRLEFRVRSREGGEHWLWVRGQAQWDGQGHVSQMAGVVFDITAYRQRPGQDGNPVTSTLSV